MQRNTELGVGANCTGLAAEHRSRGMQDWRFGPPVLIGEKVEWVKNSQGLTESGVVRWIGKLSSDSTDWTVGLEVDNALPFGGSDGSWGDRRLFHCHPSRGVFLPLNRIQKSTNFQIQKEKSGCNVKNREQYEDRDKSKRRQEVEQKMTSRTFYDLPERIDNLNGNLSEFKEVSTETDDLKLEVRRLRKSVRKRKKRNRTKEDSFPADITKRETRRPLSVTSIKAHDGERSRGKPNKKYESCILEEVFIHNFIQREIQKQNCRTAEQNNMDDVKGNFKRIDEDDISIFGGNHVDLFQRQPVKDLNAITGRMDAFNRREKSNGFFSFLKWFKKSKEMPEFEIANISSVTSSPLFVRKRSSSCGSVDTVFSIATANSFAFVPPMQYQAVISSSHTTYTTSPEKTDDETKSRNQSDYENNPSPRRVSDNNCEELGKKKKYRAPGPPYPMKDISLPSTLEHRRENEDTDSMAKGCHRRTASESFKDKKAGFYCHVQGKRKAPLPPPTAPLYPSLTSLKNHNQSISKKKRPAPQPPNGRNSDPMAKAVSASRNCGDSPITATYDNIPFVKQKEKPNHTEVTTNEKGVVKTKANNFSPLMGLTDKSSSPLPSRPWYKRSSSSNISKKESIKHNEKKKNKESEEWMPEVGYSRRPVSTEASHNLFNLLARLDKNQDRKKEERRKSQISILANISELDREAAEIVRREHAQEKKLIADKDEKYYNNVLSSFPSIYSDIGAVISNHEELKPKESPGRLVTNPFDEFKPNPNRDGVCSSEISSTPKDEPTLGYNKRNHDANKELDYYTSPWNCPICTLENPGWEKFCEACNTMRIKFNDVKKTAVENPQNEERKTAVNAMEGHSLEKSKSEAESEGKGEEVQVEEPSEDNVEGVRRKRLAFFTSRQSSSAERVEDVEELKLKIMLKEIKNSLPKREKGVINNMHDAKDDAMEIKRQTEAAILDCSSNADVTEHSNAKVQQTRPPMENQLERYGAIKKVKQKEEAPLTEAETIIVTQTTVYEDVYVKKDGKSQKVSTSVQTNPKANEGRGNGSLTNNIVADDTTNRQPSLRQDPAYVNINEIREAGILDFSTCDNDLCDEDIEAITTRLQQEGAGSNETHSYKVATESIQATASKPTETNTIDVSRLLQSLESAINTGQHLEAANIAKELARMKVGCSVKRQAHPPDSTDSKIVVDLYIEDKLNHKGPIKIQLVPSITLGQLKSKIEREWNIPRIVQRWILGRQLATDDSKTLEQHGVFKSSNPMFLYVVAPEQQLPEGREYNYRTSKNAIEPIKVERRGARVSTNYSEARRPSLIVEEDGEGAYEEHETNVEDAGTENGQCVITRNKQQTESKSQCQTPSANFSKNKELIHRQNSRTPVVFEKREMAANLKKELKVISANSVKDRIAKLNRAALGGSCEQTEANQDARKGKNDAPTDDAKQKWHYNQLVELENTDLVTNIEPFECPICITDYAPGEGVVLKDCLHVFCRACLVYTIQFNEEAEVKCPFRDMKYSCDSVLQQREIKSLVPKGLFEQHLAKSVSVAENNIGNTYHCKTPDCRGWCILEDNVNEFRCPVCKKINCLTCQSIHMGLNCRQYQEQIQFASDTNIDAKKTREMLQEMVQKGEAMACPTCQVVLMKKWGCDWLRCSMCKTEICWVTRGPRWGPGGKGDNSGGCQCGVNGVKCHPKCNYCH